MVAGAIHFTHIYQYTQNPLRSTVLDAGYVLGLVVTLYTGPIMATGSVRSPSFRSSQCDGFIVEGLKCVDGPVVARVNNLPTSCVQCCEDMFTNSDSCNPVASASM